MADQKRWFKLWCSAPSDDDIQSLPAAIRWAWVAFGAYTKEHGTKGTVTVRATNNVLAAQMGVTVAELFLTINMLPHMTISEVQNRHGEITVTWHNWVKYQEDSTQAARARASRSKRRGEEKRGEESKESPAPDAGPVDKSKPEKPKVNFEPLIKMAAEIAGEDKEAAQKLCQWTLSMVRTLTKEPPERTAAVVRASLENVKQKLASGYEITSMWGLLTTIFDSERTKYMQGPEHEANKKAVPIPTSIKDILSGMGR